MMGININDSTQDFTGQILRGEKTIETRSTRSLDPYIGERVGIVRTGVGKATLVGYATVGEPVSYDSVAKFRRDYDKHLVAPGSAFDMKDRLKYGYPLMQVESVEPREIESRGIVARRINPYTRPDLRERLKRKIMAGDKGGNPGQWSARKAQLLAAEYEKAGGGYTGGRSKSQRSLSKWTKQDWRTKSGKPSLETGERYLPAAAIAALTSAEYAATTRAKRKATRQFSRQPRRIAMKTKEFRNPVAYPKEEITYAALSPTQANKDIAAGKAFLETPAFKKWFGDSKVRDLAKRPMVVYHGTCASGFTEFDPTKTREMGFHFGTPPQAKDFLKGCGTYRGSKPGIYPVYLSIQNPIFTPDVYSEEPTYFIEWLEKTNHIHEWFPDEDDSYYRSLNKLRGQLAEAKSVYGPVENQMKKKVQKAIWGLLRKVVTRKGYDGVRYKNENEGNTDDPSNIAWIAFSPGQIKSATENILTFDRRDPDIRNPMDPSSAFTQIAGTKGTYAEAAKMIGGKVIDYGAGYGLGTDVMRDAGLSVDSYEPFPEKWKGKRPPTFTSSEKIPDARYDSLVSFSVVNVVKPDERKKIFRDVARILRPGGVALITGRTPDDVEKAKTKVPHLEKGGYMIDQGVRRRYQKGFTQSELEQYAREILGPGFKVERNPALNGASIKVTKIGKAKSNPLLYPPDQVRAYETEVQSRLGFPDQTQLGADLNLQRHRQWNTDEFRKWFGDSVVTKPNGAPLLVYHGTCRAGFTKFDPTKTREMGFHFGTWAQAKDFVGGCEKSEIPGVGPGVYPVYLSIQRALETPDLYSSVPISFIRWIEETNPVYKWFTGKDDPYFKKLKYLQNQASMAVYKFSGGEASELSKFLKMSNKKTWNHLKAIIMRKGYDGIRYKNMSEGNAADPNNIAWIAFSPAQVKSATDNRGTFNRRDAALDNPIPSMVRSKLSRIIEPGDRILCYDRAQGEDLYRLWDMIHTATPLTKDALVEIEGMLDDDGVLVIESGEEPPGLRDHFRKVIRYSGMLLVQGPMNPEEARINTEKLRRDLE